MTVTLPKVRVKLDEGNTFWKPDLVGLALDEDGEVLSSHICSNESFVRSDLIRPHHVDHYRERYPDGFEVVWDATGDVLLSFTTEGRTT